jgi:hypothetical protein
MTRAISVSFDVLRDGFRCAQPILRDLSFTGHSQNKIDGTAEIAEHRTSHVVVGAGNANT